MNISPATRTHTLRAFTAVGIAAAAMLALAGTAAAAVPTHATAPAIRVGMNEVDSLTDLVPYNLQLTNAFQGVGPYGPQWFNGEYPSQNEIHSGYNSTWGITDWVYSDGATYYNEPWNVQYQFTDSTGATDTVTMALPNQSPANSAGTCSIDGPTAGNYTCGTNGNNQFYLAAANPQNLSQANRDQFAQSLSNLCNGPHSANGHASCTFTPAANTFHYFVDPQGYAGNSDTMPGCFPWGTDGQPSNADINSFNMTGSTSTTNSFSDSLGESATVGVDGVATVGINNTTTWGHEFTKGVSYGNTVPVAARYGYLATAQMHPVDAAITGNFTATLGNVTYTLNGVTLSSTGVMNAHINGQPYGQAVADVVQIPMTPAMWNANCSGDVAPAHLPTTTFSSTVR